jgi:hypothetical protein
MVNYRWTPDQKWLIVDKDFDKGVLYIGHASNQQKVVISKQKDSAWSFLGREGR